MKLISFIALLLLPIVGYSQLKVHFAMGTGTYKMTELRSITKEARKNYEPLPAKIIDLFPPYYVYDFGLTNVFRNGFLIGGGLSYASSGSRVSYSDYSGKVQFDVQVASISYGATIGFRKTLPKEMFLTFDFRHGTTNSWVDVEEQPFGGNSQVSSMDQTSIFVQPTITFSKVRNRFSFEAHVGCFASIPSSSYEVSFGSSGSTSNSYTEKLIADWTGVRVGLGVGYIFRKKKAEPIRVEPRE